jgi:hypothetical protein
MANLSQERTTLPDGQYTTIGRSGHFAAHGSDRPGALPARAVLSEVVEPVRQLAIPDLLGSVGGTVNPALSLHIQHRVYGSTNCA